MMFDSVYLPGVIREEQSIGARDYDRPAVARADNIKEWFYDCLYSSIVDGEK